MEKIYITKPFLPPLEEYVALLQQIWDSQTLTNQGTFVKKLECELKKYLNVDNLHYLSNGTIALQLALSSLDINDGEVITTPFSYVATVSAILWQRCKPVFVDINEENFTIDVSKIEQAITSKTRAILAVHVYGHACYVEKIQEIADKYNLKVIYDGAHAFGTTYRNKSILSYGDITTLSFHATKLFHTIEGGACIVNTKSVSDKLELQKRFGHNGDRHFCLGINAKQSELHAAMGLASFPYVESILQKRKTLFKIYDEQLKGFHSVAHHEAVKINYSYYPVIFKSEKILLQCFKALADNGIYPRRYFYPSLNTLPYLDEFQSCPVSESIAMRIACLPLSYEYGEDLIFRVCDIINQQKIMD